ncbi:leucine-rich repeat extensin-like protein 5 [Penaeus chinensis]|uniref:leucine-rich repeat extensin-like protein 5 n=1 Tax=Penaeus chinensis TaxID=139456 RepID=UPI001FB656CB|nr:leucine-rich repeat extensin-like protein 5 [Penaeus chinensis]
MARPARGPRARSPLGDYLSPRGAAGRPAAASPPDTRPRPGFPQETSHEAPQRPVPPTPDLGHAPLSPPPHQRGRQAADARAAHRGTSTPPSRGGSPFVDANKPSRKTAAHVKSPDLAAGPGYPALVTPPRAGPRPSCPCPARPPARAGLPRPPHCLYSHTHKPYPTRAPGADERKAPRSLASRRMRSGGWAV